ncbi:hypothetical protein IF2G_06483 [Cordyceps javanica]|nr:hypothetical protein IF2G_06483 [Cordyceps javanica]
MALSRWFVSSIPISRLIYPALRESESSKIQTTCSKVKLLRLRVTTPQDRFSCDIFRKRIPGVTQRHAARPLQPARRLQSQASSTCFRKSNYVQGLFIRPHEVPRAKDVALISRQTSQPDLDQAFRVGQRNIFGRRAY